MVLCCFSDKDCVSTTEVFDLRSLSQSNLKIDQDGVLVHVEPVISSPDGKIGGSTVSFDVIAGVSVAEFVREVRERVTS